MLIYKNGRLHYSKFSFAILDDFYLKTESIGEANYFITLVSPDKRFSVDLSIIEDSEGAYEELVSVIEDMAPSIVYPISPISINGIQGYHATYRAKRTQYYEAWLDIDSGVTFNLVIETTGDILSIDCTKLFADVAPQLKLNELRQL